MTIGFGQIELDKENETENLIRRRIANEYLEGGHFFFSENFGCEIELYVSQLAAESQYEAKQYKSADDYPDRYTYFYPHVLRDASTIVVIIKFHHINRRHAMSPDGWGLLVTERIFYVNEYDIQKEKIT